MPDENCLAPLMVRAKPGRGVTEIVGFVAVWLLAGPAVADQALRDPTRPYAARMLGPIATAPRFELNAIFQSDTRRIAIVNGQRVGVGDGLDGATVTDISADSVALSYAGRTITAALTKSVKRRGKKTDPCRRANSSRNDCG